MDRQEAFFKDLYKNFNARNIDEVIAHMTDAVQWANGMEGGYVYGKDGVKEYWLRQFQLVSSEVTPESITTEGGAVKIKVHQVVHDVNGQLLADEYVDHFFELDNNKVAVFRIGEKEV